jgi:hypothetical protein
MDITEIKQELRVLNLVCEENITPFLKDRKVHLEHLLRFKLK